MFADTTIYGYIIEDEGIVLCVNCWANEPDPRPAHSRLYSWANEDVHGVSCEGCGGYIFEPMDRHAFKPSAYSDKFCTDCGEYEDDFLHEVEEEGDI